MHVTGHASKKMSGKWPSVTISSLKQLATSPESLQLSEAYFVCCYSVNRGKCSTASCNDATSPSQKIESGPQDWHG